MELAEGGALNPGPEGKRSHHAAVPQVRVRRPNDYNPAAANLLGPPNPNPALNLGAIGLGQVRSAPPRALDPAVEPDAMCR